MKKVEFNLERAKAGAKLVTRDGKQARNICWDWKRGNSYKKKIIALVLNEHEEVLSIYGNDGKISEGLDSPDDLFILEEPKLRPYSNAEEFLRDMKEHGPMLLNVDNDCYYTISRLDADEVFARDTSYNYDLLKELYVWQDGSPCGVEEGGME